MADDIYQFLDKNLYVISGVQQNADGTVTANLTPTAGGSSTGTETAAESLVSGEVHGDISFLGGFIQSKNFETGVSGWRISADGSAEFDSGYFRGDITGATGTFTGTVNVASLNIPDATTANSMHVDSSGNTWWGSNVADGYSLATAYILSTGAAVFKNIAVGGNAIQYVITNSGIFSFGDGSDGTATCDGSTAVSGMSRSGSTYTISRDVYFDTLTVDAGVTVVAAGYRIFVKNLLTVNGTIHRNGGNSSDGGNAVLGVGGAGGSATTMSDGYLKGAGAPGAGGNGGNTASGGGSAGGNGVSVTNSLGTSSFNGQAGASSTSYPAGGGAAGTGGTATASNVKLIANWHLATMLDISSTGSTVKFTPSATGGGGGGGAPHVVIAAGGGGGGGAGCSGGIVTIYARSIVIGAAGSITATGGNGGNGGNGVFFNGTDDSGNGGGGPGGNGGILVLVYNSFTNGGSLSVAGGVGGVGGGIGGTGKTKTVSDGSTGVIYQFQLSL